MGLESPSLLTEPIYPKRIIWGDESEPLQGIYEQSSSQKYRLGTPLIYGSDGRKFRYAKNGGVALAKALMTQTMVLDARLVDEIQTGKTQAVGAWEITILITTGITLAEDDLQDAFLLVNKATGMGDVYKILASKVGSTDTQLTLLLDSPLRTALDATSEITIVKNKYREVIIYPTTVTGRATGVPLIAVDISYFCWLQTGGCAPILADSSTALALGAEVGVGASNGTCDIRATTKDKWGTVARVPESSECALIDLTLD